MTRVANVSPWKRLFALLLIALAPALAAAAPLGPRVGVRDYEGPNFVPLRDGVVNVAGGNFVHTRVDLDVDTRLGPIAVGMTHNSKDNTWLFNFDTIFVGGFFVDPSGAVFGISGLANGSAIGGTHWVKVSATAIKTKGGLQYEFSPTNGRLLTARWSSSAYPRG
jgi:hypothetical protein